MPINSKNNKKSAYDRMLALKHNLEQSIMIGSTVNRNDPFLYEGYLLDEIERAVNTARQQNAANIESYSVSTNGEVNKTEESPLEQNTSATLPQNKTDQEENVNSVNSEDLKEDPGFEQESATNQPQLLAQKAAEERGKEAAGFFENILDYYRNIGEKTRSDRRKLNSARQTPTAKHSSWFRQKLNNLLSAGYLALATITNGGPTNPEEKNTGKDIALSIINGAESNFTNTAMGKMAMNNRDIENLNTLKKYEYAYKNLELLQKLAEDRKTPQLILAADDAANTVAESMEVYGVGGETRYEWLRRNYGKYIGSEKDYDKLNLKIDAAIKGKEEDNAAQGDDLQWARGLVNQTAQIYKVSDEWKKKEQSGSFWYNLPQGLGTSVGSMGTSLVNYATIAAVNAGVGAATGGGVTPAAPFLATGAAVLGLTTTIATNAYSRYNESLSEVGNNLNEEIHNLCEMKGIDEHELAEGMRDFLRQKTGSSYSNDPNDTQYRDDSQVIEDAVAYNILTGEKDIDAIIQNTRQKSREIFDRNMALMTSDVMQDMLVIPGFGKLVKRASDVSRFSKVTGTVSDAVEGSEKFISKYIGKTISKVTKKAVNDVELHKIQKYYVDPTLRVLGSSVLEGNEELKQDVIPIDAFRRKEMVNDKDLFDSSNWKNNALFNASELVVKNKWDLLRAYGGILGITGDPALDDNEDLFRDFGLGFMIGLISDGVMTTPLNIQNVRSYNNGAKVAQQLALDNIDTKEKLERYRRYAQLVDRKVNRDAFLDGIDKQIDENAVPTGWTTDDLKEEKQHIANIYDRLRQHEDEFKVVAEYANAESGLQKDDDYRRYAVALSEYYMSEYEAIRDKIKNGDTGAVEEWNDLLTESLHFLYDEKHFENTENNDDLLKLYIYQACRLNALEAELARVSAYREEIVRNEDELSDKTDRLIEFLDEVNRTKKIVERIKTQLLTDKNNPLSQDILDEAVSIFDGMVQNRLGQEAVEKTLEKLSLQKAYNNAKLVMGVYRKDTPSMKEMGRRVVKGLRALNEFALDTSEIAVDAELADESSVPQESESTVTNEPTNVDDTQSDDTGITIPGAQDQEQNVMPQSAPSDSEESSSSGDQEKITFDDDDEGIVPQETEGLDAGDESAANIDLPTYVKNGDSDEEQPFDFDSDDESSYDIEEEDTEEIPEIVLPPSNPDEDLFPEGSYLVEDNPIDPSEYFVDEEQSQTDEPVTGEDYSGESENNFIEADETNAVDQKQQTPVVPETPTPTVVNDDPINSASEEDLSFEEQLTEEDAPSAKSQSTPTKPQTADGIAGTLWFGPTNTTPMLEGYQPGVGLSEFLATPGAWAEATVTAFVGEPTSEFGQYSVDDRSTWDNAVVYIEVTSKDGKKYLATLRTPQSLEKDIQSHLNFVSAEAVDKLREMRNKIIEAKNADPNCVITFGSKTITDGYISQNRDDSGHVINRNPKDVECLGVSSNPRKNVLGKTITIGVGRGIRGKFAITDHEGNVLPGFGGSGTIYLYSKPEASPSNRASLPIKLNPKRFASDALTGLPSNLCYKLAKACLYGENERIVDDINNATILELLLNYGEKTIVSDDPEFSFLRDKQFYFDYKNDKAYLGAAKYKLSDLRANPDNAVEVIARFIQDNLHYNTSEHAMFNQLSNEFAEHFKNTGDQRIVLDENTGLQITREDLGLKKEGGKIVKTKTGALNGIQWMFKNGLLLTDVKDTLFERPFASVGDVQIKFSDNPGAKKNETVMQDPVATPGKLDWESLIVANAKDAENSNLNTSEETDITENSSEDASSDTDTAMNDFFGDLGGPLQRTSIKEVAKSKRINTIRAKRWLKRLVGLESEEIEIIDGFIKEFVNGEAVFGVARLDSILLSNLAAEGVEFHEAFHRVSLLMLTKDQRKKMYDAYRQQNVAYENASDAEIEEALADAFMDYMLQDQDSSLKYFIISKFRQLKRFIGINSKFNPADFNKIFNQIKYGDFRSHMLDTESKEEFTKKYKEGAFFKIGKNRNVTLSHFKTVADLNDAINSLVAMTIVANDVKYITDVHKIDMNKTKDLIKHFLNTSSLTTEQKAACQEILDNFEHFSFEAKSKFEKIGLRQIDVDADENFIKQETTGIENYNKASYEFDKKKNALGAAKLFLSTLSDTYFGYKKVNGKRVRVLCSRRNPVTGLPQILDYDIVLLQVMKKLSDVESYATAKGADPKTSLIGRCQEEAKTSPLFAFLHKRLLGNLDLQTQTQILLTIKSFSNDFTEVSYTRDRDGNTFFVRSANNKREIKETLSTWSSQFFNSSCVTHSGSAIKPNKNFIDRITSRYDELVKTYVDDSEKDNDARKDFYLGEIIKLLNAVGVNIDKETFGELFTSDPAITIKSLLLNRDTGALFYLFKQDLQQISTGAYSRNVNGRTVNVALNNFYERVAKTSILYKLANALQIAKANGGALFVLGPDNALFYTKTQNCYVSDLCRWLNNGDERTIETLNKNPYCEGSLILNTVNDGQKIALHTMANFYGEQQNDPGRGYMDLSEKEDYLLKMALTQNDHIIFPTMADKGTWFTITGVKLFNGVFSKVSVSNGRLHIRFDENVLQYYLNAWKAEFNTIQKYWEKQTGGHLQSQPVKNYHTANKGGLFRYFDGYYVTINGEQRFKNLNAVITEAVKNGNISEVLEDIRKELFVDTNKTKDFINSLLLKELNHEVETATKLGLVQNENNILTSKGLDARVYYSFTQNYQMHPQKEVVYNAQTLATLNMLANFMVNQNVSCLETEKIITGDVAFYKNNDDRIKRLGAVLSTGDNMRTEWATNNLSERKESTRLDLRQTYTCAVFSDNEILSAQYEQMKDMFTRAAFRKILINEGKTEQEVDEILKDFDGSKETYKNEYISAQALAESDVAAYGVSGSKGAINQADAAVYVSPQMYKDIMIMLGEWNKQTEAAFKIMEESDDWMSDPELYKKSLELIMKPLKTTYFGYSYNGELELAIPVFNKMAMFPLFKCLAKGDIRELYERMTATGAYSGCAPIDQVAFESAVKVGIQGKASFYSDYKNESINKLEDIPTTTQLFRCLRRQLITDPHKHDRTLFGTQVSTVAISNIVPERVYQEGSDHAKTGNQIYQDVFGSINALSTIGKSTADSMFSSDGGKTLDLSKTSNTLIQEAKNSNMGFDVESALQLNNDGKFVVNPNALPDITWVESKILSTYGKKAVDLELPGGAFIQRSSFGVKLIGVNSSRLLNIREDGSMDCIISINLLKHIIPDASKKSFSEQRQWLLDHNVIGDNANAIAMGYRIPTQGLSSVSGLHVKDVLPSNVGDTIILPDEFTAQTGSDFDIDKLYVARYNFDNDGNIIKFVRDNKDASERYPSEEIVEKIWQQRVQDKSFNGALDDFKQLFEGSSVYEMNSREANENLLLESYLAVLTDKKNIDETRLPLDKVTGIIKDEILPIVDGAPGDVSRIPFEVLSPTFQMAKKNEYSSGKTGLAPFALNNKNHVLTQFANLTFNNFPLLEALGLTGLDGIDSIQRTVLPRSKYGEVTSQTPVAEPNVRILDWLSAMINAHVDVAKDPYVIRLNINKYTVNVCNFLIRSGFGKDTFYFLPQPMLKEMATAYLSTQGKYQVSESAKDLINNVRNGWVRQYTELAEKDPHKDSVKLRYKINKNSLEIVNSETGLSVDFVSHATDLMNREQLIEMLLLSRKKNKSFDEQARFLQAQIVYSEVFLQLQTICSDMSKMVQLSQIDTKKYGNSFFATAQFGAKLEAFKKSQTLFNNDALYNYFNRTFLMQKLTNGTVKPRELFGSLFLGANPEFISLGQTVLFATGSLLFANETTIKTITSSLSGYVKQQYLFHKGLSIKDIQSLFDEQNGVCAQLTKLKNDIFSNKYPELINPDGTIRNEFLKRLDVLTKMSTDTYAAPTIMTMQSLDNTDKLLKSYLKQSFEELFQSEYQEIREFAQNLFYYTLASTATRPGKNSIWDLVPTSVLKGEYSQFVETSVNQFGGDPMMLNVLFENEWKNDTLVPTVDLNNCYRLYYAAGRPQEGVVVMTLQIMPTGKNQNGEKIYTPYVKVRVGYNNNPNDYKLYRFAGVCKNESSHKQYPVYVLTNKKGLNYGGRVIREYFSTGDQSIFRFNNESNSIVTGTNYDGYQIEFLLMAMLSAEDRKLLQKSSFKVYDQNTIYPATFNAVTNEDDLNQETQQTETFAPQTTQTVETNEINNDDDSDIYFGADKNDGDNCITFQDGITIKTPFKLNQQQHDALLCLAEFINNPAAFNNTITLTGFAGTGKTSIMSIFVKYVREVHPGQRIVFSSPTHRANTVTQRNNKYEEVKTLQSLFGLGVKLDLTKRYDLKLSVTEAQRAAKVKRGQLVIVDEASMIDDKLYDFITLIGKQKQVRFIFMGDPAQLPPVNLDTESIVFKNNPSTMTLTKVERTGDNPILREATSLREGKPLSFVTETVTKNGHTEGVVYMHEGQELQEAIQKIVTSKEFKDDPLYFRVLSATNAVVEEANHFIRELIYGQNARLFEEGDLLMGYKNISDGQLKPTMIVANSCDYRVTHVGETVDRSLKLSNGTEVKYKAIPITFVSSIANSDESAVELTIEVVTNNTSDDVFLQVALELKQINLEIDAAFKNLEYSQIDLLQQRRDMINTSFLSMRDVKTATGATIWQKALDYGYAHTIHKSQGGTYSQVMLYYDTIGVFDAKTQQALKYVAVTRAKDMVYVVTRNNFSKKLNAAQVNAFAETWSKAEGWSTEYFKSNVLNRLSEAYQIYYKPVSNDRKEVVEAWMSFEYGNNKRSDVKSTTTLEAIKNGERTSTTRYTSDGHIEYWQKLKVGDVIKFKNKNGDFVKVEVTQTIKPLTELIDNFKMVDDAEDAKLVYDTQIGNMWNKQSASKAKDTAFLYGENAQADAVKRAPKEERPSYVLLNVNSGNAVVRTDIFGNVNQNAYGVIVKKILQNTRGTWQYQDGCFLDTDSDFDMFKTANSIVFDELTVSGLTKFLLPEGFAINNAALPKRFAEWLSVEMLNRFGIESTVVENTNPNYNGFGIKFKKTDVNNTENTANDPTNFNDRSTSRKVLESRNTILTNDEALKLRPYAGDSPRIAVASEHSDPALFAKQIIDVLDNKRTVLDKFGRTYNGSDFAALYIITKHDGLPIKQLLQYPIPKIVHFSVTGLGNSKYEPGVMKYSDMLDRIEELIQQGLDPQMCTMRIDPIIPGVTPINVVEDIIMRSSQMGITKIRCSVLDKYSTTKKYMEALGYNYTEHGYSVNDSDRHASPEVVNRIVAAVKLITDKYGCTLSTCAENINVQGVLKEACLSTQAVKNLLHISDDTVLQEGHRRKYCSCYGGKIDLLAYDTNCTSCCAYCYAHHNNDKTLQFYNEDGSIKNIALTTLDETSLNTQKNSKSGFINHSGGAIGSDSAWSRLGEKYGVTSKHYYYGNPTPMANTKQSDADYNEGVERVKTANRKLNRKNIDKYMNLLAQSYNQVKYSDAVYAIGTLLTESTVNGGTGWAVQMAIDAVKPVYIFDQEKKHWYTYDFTELKFKQTETPALTPNFAGIGTREINAVGVDAIKQVYEKTFGKQPLTTKKTETINVYFGTNDHAELSNFALRPFTCRFGNDATSTTFQSVEQAFLWYKVHYLGDPLFAEENKTIEDSILKTTNGFEIRALGRNAKINVIQWDAIKDKMLKSLMEFSFKHNQSAKEALLATGNAIITHKNKNGVVADARFAPYLTEIRENLRKIEEEGKDIKNKCKG